MWAERIYFLIRLLNLGLVPKVKTKNETHVHKFARDVSPLVVSTISGDVIVLANTPDRFAAANVDQSSVDRFPAAVPVVDLASPVDSPHSAAAVRNPPHSTVIKV